MKNSGERTPLKAEILKWALPVLSVGLTLLVALAVIRWLAPQWLGLPVNLRMVRLDTAVPPFFDNVFRRTDYGSTDFLIPDPVLKRARPLYPDLLEMGPHDILGFRNRAVPNCADIVAIGDSQTYGNNVPLEESWPGRAAARLPKGTNLYNMSVGGWGAIEYLEAFPKACHLLPRVVIVAFYTGNDALESFAMAYGDDRWASLRPNSALKAGDAPAVSFPAPPAEWWTVTFRNGRSMTFTPGLRLAANQDHPAVSAGYDIMAEAAQRLASLAGEIGVKVVFTVVPTKELVYARRIEREGIAPPPAYGNLLREESARIAKLTAELKRIPGTRIVNLTGPLQTAALTETALYPEGENGHPLSAGYAVIGEALTEAVRDLIPTPPRGLVQVPIGHSRLAVFLVKDGKRRLIESAEALQANGRRPEQVRRIQPRDVANIPFGGTIRTKLHTAYGPRPGR